MVAMMSLFDAMGDGGSSAAVDLPIEERVRLANVLVSASLGQRAHIEELDTYGPNRRSRRFLAPPTAAIFRAMFDDWLAEAEVLVSRIQRLQDGGHPVARLSELRDTVASTRALLRMNADAVAKGLEQIRQGRFVTLEEGRRALRAARGQ